MVPHADALQRRAERPGLSSTSQRGLTCATAYGNEASRLIFNLCYPREYSRPGAGYGRESRDETGWLFPPRRSAIYYREEMSHFIDWREHQRPAKTPSGNPIAYTSMKSKQRQQL